jgi:hypothetical protein
MTASSWITNALGSESIEQASTEASRRRLNAALGIGEETTIPNETLRFVSNAIELLVFDLLEDETKINELREAASQTFQIARTLPWPEDPVDAGKWLVRLGSLAVLGDRAADLRRLLSEREIPALPTDAPDWGKRVWSSILDIWIRLLRKRGWDDLDTIQARVTALRKDQRSFEPDFLKSAQQNEDPTPAWQLIVEYHLAKAAEILALYLSQGSADGRYDVLQQLEAQFDRAIGAAGRGHLMELESLGRLLARTAQVLVENSIWTVTRAVNSRVSRFVKFLTSRDQKNPIFEMLPPQRHTLREEGLLGSGHRSVVVSLPTSSGKTVIAEFRMLQALNQFEEEKGWVAYLAPTRALVNQITVRLRRDFGPIGIIVEKVSPALEVDGLEAGLLTNREANHQFRVLVTTPEKLDLMLRGGWEEQIGRPLTLVVVDEAHGLASRQRGLKLELLLATINRECRYAQFLLLTPFIHNTAEIARWLAPDSNKDIELGLDWSPNDRAVVIAQPLRGEKPGAFSILLRTRYTSKSTLTIPEELRLSQERPLGLPWSSVISSPGKLSAAIAEVLRERGTIIVLSDQPNHTWNIAETFKTDARRVDLSSGKVQDINPIQQFLALEMGDDFPLGELLEYGVGVHHAGLSDDSKALIEWLTETEQLNVLVATTTIAQGVNFPVAGVVLASSQYPMNRPPYHEEMPPEDFWNIAGRAGRVDQGDLGIVALAATTDAKAAQLESFVGRAIGELSSTLIEMVQRVVHEGKLLQLESLAWQPEWSSFVQYLAHTYRQIGDHERFAAEVEQVLRGTLGFQALRKSHKGWADQLVQGVYNYAERLKGRPLKLVDSTGFSWETVSATLARLTEERITSEVWTAELFGRKRKDLQRMMGILLQVPEIREQLKEVTGGPQPDGDKLARMICDWVAGRPLKEMAAEYFQKDDETRRDPVKAMTRCCRNVFGRLTQTASWGLAALQSLTLADEFDKLPEAEQRSLRNLPAKVYYGVNSDEAVALRLLGVPRMAAGPLAEKLGVRSEEQLSELRGRVRATNVATWTSALGDAGAAYRRVWEIIEGEV